MGRCHLRAPAGEEVRGVAAVEGLIGVGGKIEGDPARRGLALARPGEHPVERLPVVAHHVHDVGLVLQTAFDFERRDTGVDQVGKVSAKIEVAQRQQVTIADNGFAVTVD